MGINLRGAIGLDNLSAFAIATTFRPFVYPWKNTNIAWCKICGTGCQPDTATATFIMGVSRRQNATVYLCPSCYTLIDETFTKDGRFDRIPLERTERYTRKAQEAQDLGVQNKPPVYGTYIDPDSIDSI